jgi:3'-phosphoadenosine 5'-phosphosulfate sulfotransferase (PAPS reductase)/FAD synthetase
MSAEEEGRVVSDDRAGGPADLSRCASQPVGAHPSREKANPYFITGPALISFSGGRTSAYMLKMILDAHGGVLPDDVHVCFANTGKEREETLRFVHECATRWNVRVRWLEWLPRPKGLDGRRTVPGDRFAEIGFNSASRNGEPFAALIARKQYTPNSVTRFCTQELKIEVMKWFMQSLGYAAWSNVIGLRADEMHRVFKSIERSDSGKQPWKNLMPMASVGPNSRWGRSVHDVRRFWHDQPFDLDLEPYEGNCDLCFLKSRGKLKALIRDEPSRARWWDEMERTIGKGRFVTEYSYGDLVREVQSSPLLALEPGDDDEFDAECGLWCAPDDHDAASALAA